MGGLTILGIALGLAMDAFAVAIAVGLSIPALTRRHVFRLAWHFALFQAMMPVIGWLAGRTVSSYIAAFDHWVAFGLLSVIGGKMIYEAGHPEQAADRGDPTRGLMLVTLSVATSIDALAVGLSLAFLDLSIWLKRSRDLWVNLSLPGGRARLAELWGSFFKSLKLTIKNSCRRCRNDLNSIYKTKQLIIKPKNIVCQEK